MDTIKKIFRSSHAEDYDAKAMKSQWVDPAIVFGLAYRFINAGESVLDIGIGTGLSSELFFKAGLNIYGLDFSPEMIVQCQKKQMTVEIKEHDLSVLPYPYKENLCHHAVCTGVTHIFDNLNPIFSEVARITRNNGIFSFVVSERKESEDRAKTVVHKNTGHKEVKMYSYSQNDMQKIFTIHNFEKIYELQFWAAAIANKPGHYRAYLVRNLNK